MASPEFNWDDYAPIDASPEPSSFNWSDYNTPFDEEPSKPTESLAKKVFRGAAQVPLGYLKKYTYPADIAEMGAIGAAKEAAQDLYESDWINKLSAERYGHPFIPIDKRQVEEQGAGIIGRTFPSQSNIERLVEESTGLPLTPQSEIDKLLRLGGEAAGFRQGNILQKGTAGVIGGGVKAAADALGVPEWISNILALGASGLTPVPGKIGKNVRPSGMVERRYESLNKPTVVSPSRAEKIVANVENDFRKASEKHLGKNATYAELKENPSLRYETEQAFDEVKGLSKSVPGEVPKEDLLNSFRQRYRDIIKEKKGITDTEYEKAFKKEMSSTYKDIVNMKNKGVFAENLEEQFRKNNKSLGEYFEPGKSSAANRAKKEALLEYNRMISDIIEKKWPNSEFSNLFKESNKRWTQIMDIEKAEGLIDDIFQNGKINYKNARKLIENDYASRPFKRILGEQGYKDFRGLVEDLSKTESPMKYIRRAEKEGFGKLAKDVVTYGFGFKFLPIAAIPSATYRVAKEAWKAALDKPKLFHDWSNGIDAFKRGAYKEAQKDFERLNAEVKAFQAKRPEEVLEAPKKAYSAPKQNETIDITPKKIEGPGEQKRLTHKQKPKPPKPTMQEAQAKARERAQRKT